MNQQNNIKQSLLLKLIFIFQLTFLNGDFIRDNSNEIVLDTTTNLIWQDNSDVSNNTHTWTEAITYCQNLTLASKRWHLPNIKELHTIVDFSRYAPSINNAFTNTQNNYYWSSTNSLYDSAWIVDFDRGSDNYYQNKTNSFYVRCVSSL
jgi:hypothetical protein